MKTVAITLLAVVALAAALTGRGDSLQLDPSGRYAEGELLVKLKGGLPGDAVAKAHAQVGAKLERSFRSLGWQRVKLPDAMSVREGIEAYRALGNLVTAEPNYVRRLCAVPDDPGSPANGRSRGSARPAPGTSPPAAPTSSWR